VTPSDISKGQPPGAARTAVATGHRHQRKISVVLGLFLDRPPLETMETAVCADKLGFGELWIGEMATFDAFVLASAVAARTEQIALTVGPLAVGVRDPVNIAMGVGSLGALTGRPVHVALGTSSDIVVRGWHGRPRGSRSVALLDQSATVLRPLLDGEKVVYAGSAVSVQGFRLRVPSPTSSITVAAFGPKAVAAAARHADRLVLNLVTPSAVRAIRQRMEVEAADAGRLPPRLAVWVPAAVDPNEETWLQMRRSKVPYLGAPGYSDMFAAAGFGRLVDFARTRPHPGELLKRIPNTLVQAVGAVGGSAEIGATIAAYWDAGADELAFIPSTLGDPGGERTLVALQELLGPES